MSDQPKGRCGGWRKLCVPIYNRWRQRQCIVGHLGECVLWIQIGDAQSNP